MLGSLVRSREFTTTAPIAPVSSFFGVDAVEVALTIVGPGETLGATLSVAPVLVLFDPSASEWFVVLVGVMDKGLTRGDTSGSVVDLRKMVYSQLQERAG